MQDYKNLIMFLTMFVIGFFLEVILVEGRYWFDKEHKNENHFTGWRYVFLLLFPILGLLLLAGTSGYSVIISYLVFGFVGMGLEALIGFAYHMVLGSRLWTYHRMEVFKYTSWLTIPIWGFIGTVFVLLEKVLY